MEFFPSDIERKPTRIYKLNPTSQPSLKKLKVTSHLNSHPPLKKPKLSVNPTSQPPFKKPEVSSNSSSPKTTKAISQTSATINPSPQTSQRQNIAAKNLILTRREKKRQAVAMGPVTCTIIDVETLSPKLTEKKWIDNSLYSLSALD